MHYLFFFIGKRHKERKDSQEKVNSISIHCLRRKGVLETPDPDEDRYLELVKLGAKQFEFQRSWSAQRINDEIVK